MAMDTELDLAAMSGEASYRSVRLLELNEVSLNGDGDIREVSPGNFKRQGGYFRKRVLVGHKRTDGKPEEIELGDRIAVVFLKIRRKLVERGNEGDIIRSTSEHNHKDDVVTLFETGGQRIVGKASELRETYPNLRTVQIVYALLKHGPREPELVRVMIRGSSLGSEAKAADVLDFYQYIASFPRGNHIWEFNTNLSPVLEEGKKTYFAINFERGEALSEPELEFAISKLKEVHANCVEVDGNRAEKMGTIEIASDEEDEDTPSPSAEDDEFAKSFEKPAKVEEKIDPADIPF